MNRQLYDLINAYEAVSEQEQADRQRVITASVILAHLRGLSMKMRPMY